jgi:4-hydroxy-2-oxoheptanedioate aldolase
VKYLKQRIQRGETVFGCWLNLGSSVSAEIVGFVGFDWVLIDDEYAKYQSLGFQLIACGSDATFVNNGALSMIEALKSKR